MLTVNLSLFHSPNLCFPDNFLGLLFAYPCHSYLPLNKKSLNIGFCQHSHSHSALGLFFYLLSCLHSFPGLFTNFSPSFHETNCAPTHLIQLQNIPSDSLADSFQNNWFSFSLMKRRLTPPYLVPQPACRIRFQIVPSLSSLLIVLSKNMPSSYIREWSVMVKWPPEQKIWIRISQLNHLVAAV